MDFSIPMPLQNRINKARAFVRERLYPVEASVQAQGWATSHELLEGLRQEARQAGLWALHMPQAWGGGGLSLMDFAHISEELGRSFLGHYVCNSQAPDAGNMELLAHFGTPEQKERFLRPLVEGRIRSCFSMTEPDQAGSNPILMDTTAQLGENGYTLNGRKWFTTAADGAAFAICMAVTDPEAQSPYARASQIIVPTDTPGFQLVRNIPVMGEAGELFNSHAEVTYTDCQVPAENLLGQQGAGFALAQSRLGPGRIHHCMRWIGICERAFDLMCQRAVDRQIAPGKPLGTRQTVQNWIAESRAEINAARLMVLQTAWKIDHEDAYRARNEISAIKFYVAGVLQRVLDRAIQTHGALGLTEATPLAFWYRHERAARIYDGPDEVHKSVIARRELRARGMRKEQL